MLEKATTLCGATFGNMYLRKGDVFELAATYNSPPALVEERARAPYISKAGSAPDRMVKTKSAVHIVDLASSEFYLSREPRAVTGVELGGVRTLVLVPMLKDPEVVGHFAIFRQEVRPFTERQIGLVKNFAAQAVIAIENTRLLNELRQRTDDLSESLEQQTATSEVLSVIGQSRTHLQPVFDAVAESARRLCDSFDSAVWRREDDRLRLVAHHGAISQTGSDSFLPLVRGLVGSRSVLDGRTFHIADVQNEGDEFPKTSENARRQGYRTILSVPLMREGVAIGAIVLRRTEARLFSERQIALLQNFADQGAIAIENVRLFEAEQERTRELSEALEQQTATSEVLRVISGSPGELEPVFNAMLANATRICEAKFGNLYLRDEDGLLLAASYNGPPELMGMRRGRRFKPGADTAFGRVIRTKHTAHVADLAATRAYIERHPDTVQAVEIGGVRTVLAVPLLKDDDFVGLISIYRQEVRPFTDKQIELLTNFAAQAVIAIENARLLNELRQRTND